MNHCSVNGCDMKYYAVGYCQHHYGQIYRLGEVRLPKPTHCSVDGCDKPNKVKGYCITHYNQMYNYGEIRPIRLSTKTHCPTRENGGYNSGECSFDKCSKSCYIKGLCKHHYSKIRYNESGGIYR